MDTGAEAALGKVRMLARCVERLVAPRATHARPPSACGQTSGTEASDQRGAGGRLSCESAHRPESKTTRAA